MSLGHEDTDPLGALCGRYCPWFYGVKMIVGGVAVAAAGGLVVVTADWIAALVRGGADPRHYVLLGGALLAGAGAMVLLGLLRTSQVFEIRRDGVRYRSWLGVREALWRDVFEIFVRKVTYVSRNRRRRSYYTITITSFHGKIVLGKGFFRSVSPIAVIQLLKLRRGRAVAGDCDDIQVPARLRQEFGIDGADDGVDGPRPGRRKKRGEERGERSGGKPLYDKARDRLAAGEPAPTVEAWLVGRGVPPDAARSIIDLALAERLVRDEKARGDEGEELERRAREQLRAGVKSEKVERWLRMQGVSPGVAAAMVANLREELL